MAYKDSLGNFWRDDYIIILIVAMVLQVYTYVKFYQIVYFKCQVLANKKRKRKILNQYPKSPEENNTLHMSAASITTLRGKLIIEK